jgi:hypothetical protein
MLLGLLGGSVAFAVSWVFAWGTTQDVLSLVGLQYEAGDPAQPVWIREPAYTAIPRIVGLLVAVPGSVVAVVALRRLRHRPLVSDLVAIACVLFAGVPAGLLAKEGVLAVGRKHLQSSWLLSDLVGGVVGVGASGMAIRSLLPRSRKDDSDGPLW